MKKPFIILSLQTILVISLSITQAILANSISTTGVELVKIEKELTSYKKENALLSEKLFITTSLTNIASSAALLGFAEEKTRVYMTGPLPLAVKR